MNGDDEEFKAELFAFFDAPDEFDAAFTAQEAKQRRPRNDPRYCSKCGAALNLLSRCPMGCPEET